MYNIGDKIRINHDLKASDDDYLITVADDMIEYRDEIAIIKYVCRTLDFPYYYIDVDHQGWAWTEDMFEPVDEDINLQALLDLI